MKTLIIEESNFTELLQQVAKWHTDENTLLTSVMIFYDRISETHKATINYHL